MLKFEEVKIMKEKVKKSMFSYLIVLIILFGVYYFYQQSTQKVNKLSYTELINNLPKVVEVHITPDTAGQIYRITGKMEGYAKKEIFFVKAATEKSIDDIVAASEEYDFKVIINEDPTSNSILNLIINLLPTAIFMIFVIMMLSRLTKSSGGAGKILDFGKSKAILQDTRGKITYDDVAGLTEEKEELKEIVEFLKNPKKFQAMGARIPKGLLLVGPPGTGKTLLARAVAGEAKVPFYSISGSDFVEMYVGVGASRVRDMFREAKKNAPCLIFIDEIDAVGRQRGTGLGGGHDEREQTLNQLLVEMDGFSQNEGIIIIAATNRPDVLDPALLRPGRFDRQVYVSLPDVKGREEILQVHVRNKNLAPEVNLKNVAKRTPGFSGADLENLLNEAALLAVRQNKKAIDMKDIDEAADRVLMGPAKKSKKYTEKEKRLVAYHEAGHAVLGLKLSDANVVHKVTIIPRGMAGGYSMMLPKEDKYFATKKELLDQITSLLGGRAAEEIVFNESSTGAHNDFERATKIARAMVTEYGMSDLGPIQLEHQESSVFLGRDYQKSRNFSDQVALEIDKEVRKIINNCYAKAKKIINENKKLLDLIAETLLEQETLTKEEIEHLAKYGSLNGVNDLNLKTVKELKDLAKSKKIKGYSKMTKEELIEAIKK